MQGGKPQDEGHARVHEAHDEQQNPGAGVETHPARVASHRHQRQQRHTGHSQLHGSLVQRSHRPQELVEHHHRRIEAGSHQAEPHARKRHPRRGARLEHARHADDSHQRQGEADAPRRCQVLVEHKRRHHHHDDRRHLVGELGRGERRQPVRLKEKCPVERQAHARGKEQHPRLAVAWQLELRAAQTHEDQQEEGAEDAPRRGKRGRGKGNQTHEQPKRAKDDLTRNQTQRRRTLC